MNELEIHQEEICGRCRGPLLDDRFSVKVDSDPPLETPVELWICERCMDSMTRWIGRRPGPGPSRAASSTSEASPGGSSVRKRRSRQSHYAKVLDDNDAWAHRKSWLMVWLTAAVVAALLGMILLVVLTDLSARFLRR